MADDVLRLPHTVLEITADHMGAAIKKGYATGHDAEALLNAALAALAEAGYVVVPRKLTPQMAKAGFQMIEIHAENEDGDLHLVAGIEDEVWRAMLDAVLPAPPGERG